MHLRTRVGHIPDSPLVYSENAVAVHRFNDHNLTWLYRYRSLDDQSIRWVERIFTHGEMYCAPPSMLNDPAELKPIYDLQGSREDIYRYVEGLCSRKFPLLQGADRSRKCEELATACEKANELYRGPPSPEAQAYIWAEFERVGVCCLSETWSSPLMWAHYSGNHSGICIRFKASFQVPFFGSAQRLSYQKDYPRIRLFKDSDRVRVELALLTKAEHWSYEQEWRILDTDAGPGIKTFPTKLIDTVLLGTKISAANEAKIRGWVKNMNPRVEIRRVVAVPGAFEMGLA